VSQNVYCATDERMRKSNHPHKKAVHFIGIGGIGVSALARYFLSKGNIISGSDTSPSELTDQLKKEGIKIFIGHKPVNIAKGVDLIIHSAAIKKDNPEIKKAEQLGIPFKSYAEALGELAQQYKTIAIAGAHGKSTTTAMASLVFIKAGLDPTVIIGTKLKEFTPPAGGNNFRSGKSKLLIIEADEYTGAFLNYSPFGAIITNIDLEHLDYYKNLAEIKKSFLKFIGNIQYGGILILNKDNKNLFSLRNKIKKIGQKNNLKLYWHSVTLDQRSQAQCNKLRKILKVSGEHNVSNALGVYTLAKALNINDKKIFDALSEYRGAWRRMEYRGELRIMNNKLRITNENSIIHNSSFIIPVYDDYAHHPTEIKATLAGIRQKWPKSAIICVFQPHQEKRLKSLFKEFAGAFDDADTLILLDIFKVKGREETKQSVNSQKLAEAIKRKSPINVLYLKSANWRTKNLSKTLKQIIIQNQHKSVLNQHKSALVIMMGAGDIYKMTDKLIK